MPLSPTYHSNPTNIQITATSFIPPPSYPNVHLPLGHQASLGHDREAPPSYEEAVIDPNAPPPSYNSTFGRVVEMHKSSKGICNFLKNIVVLFLGSIGLTILLGVLYAIPIAMIAIGAIYLDDCPQAEYIPVFLLVAGGFEILRPFLRLFKCGWQRIEERDEERQRQSPIEILINFFITAWFILGSVWVYREYEPNYDPALGKYCNKTLYLFAFNIITITYIFSGVTVLLCIVVSLGIFWRSR